MANAYRTYNTLSPENMPLTMPLQVALLTGAPTLQAFDLLAEEQGDRIDFVQSIWVDNSLNPNVLTLNMDAPHGQILKVPAFSQGVFPVWSASPFKMTVTSPASGLGAVVNIPINLLNMPQPYFCWAVV